MKKLETHMQNYLEKIQSNKQEQSSRENVIDKTKTQQFIKMMTIWYPLDDVEKLYPMAKISNWGTIIGKMSNIEFKRLGKAIEENIKKGFTRCPSLANVFHMANKTIIPKNSFTRFINGKQLTNAEKFAKRDIGSICKHKLNAKDAENRWNELVTLYQAKQDKGELQAFEETKLINHIPNEPSKAEIYGKNRNLSSNLTQSMKKRLARITELRNNNVQQA